MKTRGGWAKAGRNSPQLITSLSEALTLLDGLREQSAALASGLQPLRGKRSAELLSTGRGDASDGIFE